MIRYKTADVPRGFATMKRAMPADPSRICWCKADEVEQALQDILKLAGEPNAERALASIIQKCREHLRVEP